MPSGYTPDPELNDIILQVAKWLASAYHVAIFDHRDLTTFGLVVWAFYPKLPFQIIKFPLWFIPKSLLVGIVRCLGFGKRGVERDSLASRYQSRHYGGRIEPDGLFSHYQSVGARGYEFYEDPESKEGSWGFLRFALLLVAFLTWAGDMPDSL